MLRYDGFPCVFGLNCSRPLVFHASELRLLFGPVPDSGIELEFANTMLDFYIHFINDLNPGRMYNLHSVFPSECLLRPGLQ